MDVKKILYEIVRITLLINLIISIVFLVLEPITSILALVFMMRGNIIQTFDENGMLITQVETLPTTPMELTSFGIGMFTIILIAICYAGISYHFYCFFSNIIEGKYFLRKNGIRLRIIGGLFILISAYMLLYNGYLASVFNSFTELRIILGESNDFSIVMKYLLGIIIGMMFIIVGEAFVQGNILEEDNKLTV